MVEKNDLAKQKEELCSRMAVVLPVLRTVLNLSQTALGEYVNVSRQTISAIERGEYKMSWNQFTSFYLVFGGNKASHDVLADNELGIKDITPVIVVTKPAPHPEQEQ